MAKAPTLQSIAANLLISERVLLFCIASRTDWVGAGVPNASVEMMIVLGLIERNHTETYRLTLQATKTYALEPHARPNGIHDVTDCAMPSSWCKRLRDKWLSRN